MTANEVARIVFMLFAAFPQGDRQAPERAKVYERMLSDLDFEPCQAAVIRLVQTSKFLPTIAEVRQSASAVRVGLRRTGLEAWGDVTRAIRNVGSYRVPRFDDPIVSMAVRALTWHELCLGENESSLRARFIEAYEAMSEREHLEHAVSEPLRLQTSHDGAIGVLASAPTEAGADAPRTLGELLRSAVPGGPK